jgi:predicted RNase H-like nuclease (RuvC/YqgF family)
MNFGLRNRENEQKTLIANGTILKDGLISVWVSKEQKQEKHTRRITWANIVTMGFQLKETKDTTLWLWEKVDTLNLEIKQLKEEIEKIKKEK